MQDITTAPLPLSILSEEETMFRDAVREFAETEIKPYVYEMDEAAKFRPDIIAKFFGMGLMGIEVPEILAALAAGSSSPLSRSRSWPGSTHRLRSMSMYTTRW